MSRIGQKPIPITSGVQVDVAERQVRVKGPLGELAWRLADGMKVAVDDGHIQVSRSGNSPTLRALHGLTRARIVQPG